MRFVTVRDLLRNRPFLRLAGAHAVSAFGSSLTGLAFLLFVNHLSGSVELVALAAIVRAVPRLTIGFLAGALVDRFDRLRIMVVSDLLAAACVLALIPAVLSESLWLVFVLAFAQSALSTFFDPAQAAVLARVVTRRGLLPAYSFNETVAVVASVLGTTLAGLLVTLERPYWTAFAVDAALLVFAALLIASLRVPRDPEAEPEAVSEQEPSGVFHGVRLMLGTPVLRGVMVSAAAVMLGLGAFNVLYVPLLENELALPPVMFGAVEGVEAVAIAVSGALLALFSARVRPVNVVVVAMAVLGVSVGLMAVVDGAWFLFALMFANGLTQIPINSSLSALVQASVPDGVRGRVVAGF